MRKPKEILIVDDIPENLRLLKSILNSDNYQIRVATNGEMALKSAQLSPPSLIIMDINMPVMDGIQACIEIKKIHKLNRIPIIFISAYTEMEQISRAFKAGGCDYVSKPFNQHEVLLRIKNQLDLQDAQERQLREQTLASTISMAVGIAHEINTPLGNGITSNSYIEQKIIQFKQASENKTLTLKSLNSYISTIEEANDLLCSSLHKVRELVDTFQSLAQGYDLTPSHFELNQQIKLIESINLTEFKKNKIKLHITGQPISLYTPISCVFYLFNNLLFNSLQHAYSDNRHHDIDIDLQENEGFVSIHYQDNGIGMKDDDLLRLFDAFFTTKRSKQHAGLSATNIYNLVTQGLKGTISAYNSKEHGLCYDISFPLEQKKLIKMMHK